MVKLVMQETLIVIGSELRTSLQAPLDLSLSHGASIDNHKRVSIVQMVMIKECIISESHDPFGCSFAATGLKQDR